MIERAWHWAGRETGSRIVRPICVIHYNEWNMLPEEAARRAFKRMGLPTDLWAIADQPPQGGTPALTYHNAFGQLFDECGPILGPCRELHGWLCDSFRLLVDGIHEAGGYFSLPHLGLFDWEGFPVNPDWSDPDDIQRWVDARNLTIQTTVLAALRRVVGVPFRATNYEDRPLVHTDKMDATKLYPVVGVDKQWASPVFYAKARKRSLESVLAAVDHTIATCGDVSNLIPWVNEAAVAERLAAGGVTQCIVWGSRSAPATELVEWLEAQAEEHGHE